jgi:DNA-directed RNA polymerase specialized sigma24 family protein
MSKSVKKNMNEKKNSISIEPAIEQFLQKSIQHDHSYARKRYRWHAQYSLDRADGIDQTNAPVTDELENLFLSIEDRRALYAALQRLSSLQRRRLLMRYADRLTYSEIARREGVAPRVAQRSIERALVKLNLMLKDAILVDSNL